MRGIAPEDAGGRHGLLHFWHGRNAGNPVLLDRYTVHYVTFAIAYLCHLLRVTPNQLSILGGVSSVFAFAAAVLFPAADPNGSILWIFAFSQLAYVLDCADGQLARATNQESAFGEFLDKGIDIAGNILVFGGLFAFLYRHYLAVGEPEMASLSLLAGFFFLLVRSSRFFAWQAFVQKFGAQEERKRPGMAYQIAVSLMDHQVSLFGMLLFLLSPPAGFLLFGGQTAILAGVYVRYFLRARRIDARRPGGDGAP